MRAHRPHKQLKTIRQRLGITQMQAAAMLCVSYPYLLSVETGQRELSRPLARKIAKTFGVAEIQKKDTEPMIRNRKGKLVPFTKETFEEYTFARPSYYIPDDYAAKRGGKVVTPTPSDYARCAQALLEAAEEQLVLRPVLTDFFNWFKQSISGDAMLESVKRAFDRLFPGERRKSDAFLALIVSWARGVEDEILRDQRRKEKAAVTAGRKREKKRRENR